MGRIGRRLVSISIVGLLAACGTGEEKIVKQAEEVLEEKLNQEPQEATREYGEMMLYLPNNADIQKSAEKEYRVTYEGQIYALSLNNKQTEAEANMNIQETQPLIAEVREGEKGYLIIAPFEKDSYEVKVGFEETTMTTVLPMEDIHEQSRLMFDIVQSIEEHNFITTH
ncbi:hypothetical protein [Alkalicoccus saliphilus]|uniref:Lipoprotein n=1 Tax=Alkalicoccus saliphilus TaxID=200989 RepID=A0A2T4U8S6_9BACI|nr:hypothetical protein [Alkalicoccus saliphilus]PTL39808.1 hypothetical protein C6Y45_03960 [Alkalicoccus saliphilus]